MCLFQASSSSTLLPSSQAETKVFSATGHRIMTDHTTVDQIAGVFGRSGWHTAPSLFCSSYHKPWSSFALRQHKPPNTAHRPSNSPLCSCVAVCACPHGYSGFVPVLAPYCSRTLLCLAHNQDESIDFHCFHRTLLLVFDNSSIVQ